MQQINIIFFGSTNDSVLVLESLSTLNPKPYTLHIVAVVTQPPRPIGRKQIITPTPVEVWAKEKNIPVLTFNCDGVHPTMLEDEEIAIDALQPFKANLLISASYGQKIPTELITKAAHGGLNVHPSLLPRWRGADPVPWAIMTGDHQTGVSVITLAEAFDEGHIIAQKKWPITEKDTSDPLRTKLFEMGAELLVESLPDYLSGKNTGVVQHTSDTPYSRRFTRQDGFESWDAIQKAFEDTEAAIHIDRKFRALHPWPGVWTELEGSEFRVQGTEKKRLKILALHLNPTPSTLNPTLIVDTVQLEGKNPISFKQFQEAYLR